MIGVCLTILDYHTTAAGAVGMVVVESCGDGG